MKFNNIENKTICDELLNNLYWILNYSFSIIIEIQVQILIYPFIWIVLELPYWKEKADQAGHKKARNKGIILDLHLA